MYHFKYIVFGIILNSAIIFAQFSTKGMLTIGAIAGNDVPKHWSKYQSTVEAVGGKLITISSQQHTLRNPELTFQQGLVTRWNFLPKDWVCISDADNEVSKYYNMFLDVPLSTMNPGAENTYVGNKNGKMAQPGCVVLSGNISNNPGETL